MIVDKKVDSRENERKKIPPIFINTNRKYFDAFSKEKKKNTRIASYINVEVRNRRKRNEIDDRYFALRIETLFLLFVIITMPFIVRADSVNIHC